MQQSSIFYSDRSVNAELPILKKQQLIEQLTKIHQNTHVFYFNFPIILLEIGTFQSVQHIIKLLQHEESITDPRNKNIWLRQCKPNKTNCDKFYLNCKHCKAYMRFRKMDDQWVLKNFNVSHTHKPKLYKTLRQERMFQFIKKVPNAESKSLPTIIRQRFNISEAKMRNIIKQFNTFPKKFSDLELFFNNHNYETDYIWGNEDKVHRFPQQILAISSQMKDNYQHYGDVVKLDFIQGIINIRTSMNEPYTVCIFSGIDPNLRLLIFGVALISRKERKSYEQLFRNLIRIGQKQPSSIIINQQLQIVNAIQCLQKQRVFNGVYLLDSWCVLNNLFHELKGKDMTQKTQILKQFKQIIQVTDSNKGEQLLHYMKIHSKYFQQKLLRTFQQILEKVCFWAAKPTFIGVKLSQQQKVVDLVKKLIPQEVNIYKFFQVLNRFSQQLTQKSNRRFEYQREKIQQIYNDRRIKSLRQCVQKKIFQIFIEKYTCSYKYIVKKYSNYYILKNNQKQEEIQVKQDLCSCNFHQKSGIPCQHLLAIAIPNKNIEYETLFNQRWMKKRRLFNNRGCTRR